MEIIETYDELLYGNLKLLSVRFPMSIELQQMLSKEMFAVANTKAFSHIIIYLFNCLNKHKYGVRLPWPIHDRASHLEFHNNVWEVSRRINTDYPNADVPKVQKSFFMNPSGKKFVQYLVKISSLAMLENSKFGKSLSKQPKDMNSIARRLAVLRFNLKENYDEFEAYRNENKIKIRDMCNNVHKYENMVTNANDTLRKIVEKSNFDATIKGHLLSHDVKTMQEIKQCIEEQKKRLHEFIERVNNMKTNLHELNDVICSPQNSVCGKYLLSCLPSKMVEHISINEETGITLDDLMKVLSESVNRNIRKLNMEDPQNYFPKLVTLKDNLAKLLREYENLCCEMKSFIDHLEVKIPNTDKSLFSLKESNLQYLNISTPRSLYSPSTPLTDKNSGPIIDWVGEESGIKKQLKQGLFFSPPSVDTSYMIDVDLQQCASHKLKAKYLMSACKQSCEQKCVENNSPAIVPKHNLVRRVLAMNSPEVNKPNTMGMKIKVDNSLNLPTKTLDINDTSQDMEKVQEILQNSESSITFDESENLNETIASNNLGSDWNNESFQRIANLVLSPEIFIPSNGNSTPLLQNVTASPVEALLSKEQKISRPSLEALKLRFLKVKETALSVPKLDD